uniref:Uncharacterized protein n=1 Tax=Lepeophtheirus salmonis TaxID=72036 RepID=A0A0K2UIH7_LEPSM
MFIKFHGLALFITRLQTEKKLELRIKI